MDDGERFYPTGLIRLVTLAVVLGIIVGVPLLISRLRRRAQAARGFEVKLDTGETPVPLRKKDDDHG